MLQSFKPQDNRSWFRTIGAKIFGAFLAMGLIIAVVGGYGYGVLAEAGKMVIGTFDGPMMAITYGRAAHVDFLTMKELELQRESLPRNKRAEIETQIDEWAQTFSDDLDVAQERSTAPAQLREISQIRKLLAQWNGARKQGRVAHEIESGIAEHFDMLVELNANYSFVERRKSVWAIGWFKYAIAGVTLIALLLACGITFFLSRRISRPLAAAAQVADRISKGELQTPIPPGGGDETGTLLKSMTVMQDNIRGMMERETSRALSAESRLVDALENSGAGILLVDTADRIVLANSQISVFFPGLEQNSLIGASFAIVMSSIEKGCASGGEGLLANILDLHAGIQHADIERELVDGRWIRFSANITTDGGRIVLINDFTDIKKREVEFKIAKQDAEAASAAKSRFLANMSHELRTPLNAIIGFSEILSGELFGPLGSDKYKEYSLDVLRSGRHLLDVINDVLSLTKSETGKMTFKPQTVDLRYIIKDCIKMVQEQFAAAGLSFIPPNLDAPVYVSGEKAKLRQIFLNLLSNAFKFTPEGGRVTMVIQTDGADHFIVEVIDTGIGMTPEGIAVALTPFGQVDSRLERRYEGTGLGLPLAQSLVDLHGGTMAIESLQNVGTTVRVRLARAAEGYEDVAVAG